MAFEFELRALSFVPRWSVVHLLKGQNVAEHQYYTAIYALQILDLLLGNESGSKEEACFYRDVMAFALVHDLEESYVGDIPGPVKRIIVLDGKMREFTDAENKRRYPSLIRYIERGHDEINDEIRSIVKVASLMDEVMILIQERRMGNTLLSVVETNSVNRLEAAWYAISGFSDAALTEIWATDITPALRMAYDNDLRHVLG